jgi:hypothetical protein
LEHEFQFFAVGSRMIDDDDYPISYLVYVVVALVLIVAAALSTAFLLFDKQ